MGSFRNYNYDFTNPDLYIADGSLGDPSINNTATKRYNQGNVGAGLYFNYKNFYVGASVPNLYQNKLASTFNSAVQEKHFYGMLGGVARLSSKLDLKPSMMVRFVKNSPVSFDANASIMYNKRVTLGASYRTDSQIQSESLDALAFFQVNTKLGIGLAYDFTLSKLQKYNNGSLEAMIRYDLGRSNEAAKDVFDNPRFFF
jgi:type IX secretion system PorP/SprF family membrane protein